MLVVHLRRAMCPTETRQISDCLICGRPVAAGSVGIQPEVEGNVEEALCGECLGMLHSQYPDDFPSVEEYRAVLERYPEPMFPTDDELIQLNSVGHPSVHEAHRAAWLS